jgi:glutamate 5-kinase
VGGTDFAHRQPHKRIAEVMKVCSGTIVVALRRIHIDEGTELHASSSAGKLADVNLPTVWNQIKAAMAYSLGQLLLTIVGAGLRN